MPPVRLFLGLALAGLLAGCGGAGPGPQRLLNVSYDPTRELYRDVDRAFAARVQAAGGPEVRVQQSHGGSAKQARAVMDGLPADVVTLALPWDVDAIAREGGLVPADWRGKLPHEASPFSSIVVFLVRHGNPKGLRGWDDLLKPGVAVITANPKTSGAARCAYLAAWAWGRRQGGDAGGEAYLRALYARVPVLDSGSRAATTTFVERGQGDVLLTWENEALLAAKERPGAFDRVVPAFSFRADLPVAVVEGVAGPKGTQALAYDYLRFLFTPEGQRLAAEHGFRPRDPAVARDYAARFPRTTLVDAQAAAGGWDAAQARHFASGALFDRLMEERR